MSTLGNRDCHWEPRSVLKDFAEDALTISAGSLFQNRTARIDELTNCHNQMKSVLLEAVDVMFCSLFLGVNVYVFNNLVSYRGVRIF